MDSVIDESIMSKTLKLIEIEDIQEAEKGTDVCLLFDTGEKYWGKLEGIDYNDIILRSDTGALALLGFPLDRLLVAFEVVKED